MILRYKLNGANEVILDDAIEFNINFKKNVVSVLYKDVTGFHNFEFELNQLADWDWYSTPLVKSIAEKRLKNERQGTPRRVIENTSDTRYVTTGHSIGGPVIEPVRRVR